MNLYLVTVNYRILGDNGYTNGTLNIKRRANKDSEAITVISSLFGSLSNYIDELGNPYLLITSVVANKIN